MTKDYSEDELVEKNAIKVFMEDLKYDEFMNCFEEFKSVSPLGRETAAEVVLVKKLKEAIDNLNPELEEGAKKQAIEELTKDRSRLSLLKANQEIYKLIKDGIKVKTKTSKGYEYKIVKIIDFNEPKNNDFFLASQFWITGDMYKRRTDLIGFVNGLPLILIELKKPSVDVESAYRDNITDYKDTIPHLFWYNSFIIISNGSDAKIGTLTAGYEHFNDWKKISNEKEKGIVSLDTILKGTCDKKRFLDILENFTLFERDKIKIVAKNHQFLGVNNAVEAFKNRKKNKGRLGVFWHTQGSGKSYSMIFFSQKVLRKFEGNYTFVIVTDRKELDNQIYENFQNTGAVIEQNVQAKDGAGLKKLLKEDHRMVFTLIHKFNTEKGEKYPCLSERDDVIVMTDEAHRTQYDVLALNMRNALPNACFLGFTGTPLMEGEEKTKETFGPYVSVYNFRASVDDKATVPLFYENRVPEMQILNPELNEEIYNAIDDADLDEDQEEKLETEFAREYHILTRDDRINAIAQDIAKHFVNRGYEGKAMVVSIDKFTTVRMFDKVKYYLNQYIRSLGKEKQEKFKNLDMAVVISQEQNEIKKFKEKGLDIAPHRKRIVTEKLDEAFKNPENKLQIVFVCNMWLTGFDVPCLSTIYVDKPLKNHTLMQAIARANRVFGEKDAGFIVDYINVFRNLKKALSVYAAPSAGSSVDLPIEAKDELVKALKGFVANIDKFMRKLKVDPDKIISIRGLEKIALMNNARSAILVSDNIKKDFLTIAGKIIKVYKSILPHKDASFFSPQVALYQELVQSIKSLDPEVDISFVMNDIQNILDKSISSKGYTIKDSKSATIDLSKIDFDALKLQFEKKKDNADVERLKNIISYKLKEMVRLNPIRLDFQEEFQKLVNDYNLGSLNIEHFYNELTKFSNNLKEEERRAATEGLSEEELALFDKLKKPDLTEKEKSQIKQVAKKLLDKLKNNGLSSVDWRKKQQIRAKVRKEIEMELDTGLPQSYTPEDFEVKCDVVFQHIFDNYYGEGNSAYAQVY